MAVTGALALDAAVGLGRPIDSRRRHGMKTSTSEGQTVHARFSFKRVIHPQLCTVRGLYGSAGVWSLGVADETCPLLRNGASSASVAFAEMVVFYIS